MAIDFKTQSRIYNDLKSFLSSISTRITDFNVGSVINDLFLSISNGIASLYIILQNAYSANYVSTAEDDDLDLKVAEYTLSRRRATQAVGYVTFFRSEPAQTEIVIPLSTTIKTITTTLIQSIEFQTTTDVSLQPQILNEEIIYFTTSDEYNLATRKVFDVNSITGTRLGVQGYTFIKDIDYKLDTSDASQAIVRWIGDLPDDTTIFYVTYQPLSVDAPIMAVDSGSFGNITIGAITNMVTKPAGIEEVYNYIATSGGTDSETDEELRQRVPLFLGSLSKGVQNSLKAAALSVDGVKNVKVYEPDPPNGFVTLFIDDGSGSAPNTLIRAVKDKIDGTVNGVMNDETDSYRSAGIGVNVTSPTIKEITIDMEIQAYAGYDLNIVKNNVVLNISQLLTQYTTGQTLIRAELIKIVMQTTGVENITLSSVSINGNLTGDIVVGSNEVARLKTISLRII